MSENYFPSLTTVRAGAAYMVFLHHYGHLICNSPFICSLLLEFHTGVSIFFVLSGFLITYRYYSQAQFNLDWLKGFYIKRFARIYPLFFLITLLTLLITQDKNIKDWFLSLTLLKGLSFENRFIVIPQTWSLTVEEMFYFLSPFIFLLSKRKIPLFLIFLFLFVLGILISTKGNFSNFPSGNLFILLYTFFGRAFEFFAGVFLAKYILDKKNLTDKPKKFSILTYGGLLISLGVIVALASFQSPEYRFGAFSPVGVFINILILPLAVIIFFYGLITEKTLLNKILSSKIGDILGKSSYAFYLIHMGVITLFLPELVGSNMLIFFLSLVIISILLFYLIENPLNKLIRRKFT